MLMDITFLILAAILIAAAVGVVVSHDILKSISCIVLAVCSVAVLFVLVGAEVIGMVMLLVISSSATVVFVLSFMLGNMRNEWSINKMHFPYIIVGFVSCTILLVAIIFSMVTEDRIVMPILKNNQDLTVISTAIFSQYIIPIQCIAMSLLATMVGLVVLVFKENVKERKIKTSFQIAQTKRDSIVYSRPESGKGVTAFYYKSKSTKKKG